MTETELRKRYYPIMEAWKLIKEFQDANGTDEECQKLQMKVDEIYKMSGKTEFSKAIMAATVDEIDRIMTERGRDAR